MFNLVNKGVIPRDVDLTPAFERGAPSLLLKPAKIHLMNPAAEAKREIAICDNHKNTLKFDLQPLVKIENSNLQRR